MKQEELTGGYQPELIKAILEDANRGINISPATRYLCRLVTEQQKRIRELEHSLKAWVSD
jgi:hypothetical protein